MRLALCLWVLLHAVACGAKSTGSTDGDADTDADTDGDTDADTDVECGGVGPAGVVPVQGCGPTHPDTLPICRDEVGPCIRDEECVVVNFDDCCGLAGVAILAREAEAIEARIPPCDVAIECPGCAIGLSEPQCIGDRCVLVDCQPTGC